MGTFVRQLKIFSLHDFSCYIMKMTISPIFSIQNPFPRLAELTAKASDWLTRRSSHEVNFAKWRGALDSAPVKDALVSNSSMEQAARSFSAAFSVYDDPKNPKKREALTLHDLNNARTLDESWKMTMAVAQAQGVTSPSAMRTDEAGQYFMRNVSHSVALNTTRTAVELFNADTVAYALRSAEFLSNACAAAKATSEYLLPDVQQDRVEKFRQLQGVLEANLAMGNYSDTPVLETHLREAVLQNNQALENLETTNARALTQKNDFAESPTF